jgi:ADP-heptose:LPS heptosyltransferase
MTILGLYCKKKQPRHDTSSRMMLVKLARSSAIPLPKARKMRILALVPGGIGDQLLFFPTLETLKTQIPNALIDVIVEPRSKSAYRVCSFVNEVLLFDFRDRSGLADYLNLLGIIRDREYDVALNLSDNWTVALILWLNGVPLRGSYNDNHPVLHTNTILRKSEQYQAYQYHDLLGVLGLSAACPPIHISLSENDIDWAESEQKRLNIKNSGYILLYDYASYPATSWKAVIEGFQQKQPNIPVILLDTLESEPWIAQLQAIIPNLKVVQPTDVGKLAAIVAGANLIICTEGDVPQVAIAVGTYAFALYALTLAEKRLPPQGDKFIGIQSPTDKMEDIDPETILQKLWQG